MRGASQRYGSDASMTAVIYEVAAFVDLMAIPTTGAARPRAFATDCEPSERAGEPKCIATDEGVKHE